MFDTPEQTLREFLVMDPQQPNARVRHKILDESDGLAYITLNIDGAEYPETLARYLVLTERDGDGAKLVYYWGTGDAGYGVLTATELHEISVDALIVDRETARLAAESIKAAFLSALNTYTM